MIDQKLVKNYTSCLFNNVILDSDHQKILNQISLFDQLLTNSRDLRFALYSPIISQSDKLRIVMSCITKLGFEKIISKFFRMLVKNSRFKILSSVIKQYKYLINDSRGIKLVTVESAVDKPSKKVINIIKEHLENKLKRIVTFNIIKNKSLIGGVIIKYDSMLYDYSISGTLKRLTKLANNAKM